VAIAVLLVVALGVTFAVADDSELPASASVPTFESVNQAIEDESQETETGEGSPASGLTDPQAAENLPHHDLSNDEALKLMQGVFKPALQVPAGPFDDLNVEKFLADNVAVIPAGEAPEETGIPVGEEPESPYEGPTLLNATVPLRTEGPSGEKEVVDLSLEHSEGEIQSVNPLVEVGIPAELGDGIDLPETGVQIELAGAPEEHSPSIVDQSVAFWGNVAPDTDLAVAPTATGVETLTQLRSADSPHTQTFRLKLPAGATLQMAEHGDGAEVIGGGETLVSISPPTALDATGADVPVSLEVSGHSLVLTVSPEDSTKFPILLDPLYQTYEWAAKGNYNGIHGTKGQEEWSWEAVNKSGWGGYGVGWGFYNKVGEHGFWAQGWGKALAGDHASWIYTVPRYFSDQEALGVTPTSFITHMTLSDMIWEAGSSNNQPYLTAGLWSGTKKEWVSLLTHEGLVGHGLTNAAYPYEFFNGVRGEPNTDVKLGSVGVWATEEVPTSGTSTVNVGAASVEITDADHPKPGAYGTAPQWVNNAPTSKVPFKFTDPGLGVYSVTANSEATGEMPAAIWETKYGCTGVGGNPCPRTWESANASQPSVNYDPSVMPQGIDGLELVARDPVGHASNQALGGEPALNDYVQVKVDHTAPSLSLSGTMTEQAKLGTARAHYTLKLSATDGTEAAPQSGVAKEEVKVDGKVLGEALSPGCATQNCPLTHEWPLNSASFTAGKHTVEAITTDAVGISTTKTLSIELTADTTPPSLSLSGPLTEQATLGTGRWKYALKLEATDGTEAAPQSGVASEEIKVDGTKADSTAPGCATENCALSHEWTLKSPSFSAGKHTVEAIAIDAVGKSTTKTLSIELTPTTPTIVLSGTMTEQATLGTAKAQYALKLEASDGNAGNPQPGVASTEIKLDGTKVDSSSPGCATENCAITREWTLKSPSYTAGKHTVEAIATDAAGRSSTKTLAIELTPDTGAPEVGLSGTMTEQPTLGTSRPRYTLKMSAADGTEAGEGAVGKPTYVSSFASTGSANGQLYVPVGIATDPKTANLWVADHANARVEEFGPGGEFIRAVSTKFEGQGAPYGVTVDPEGHVWAVNGNGRIQEFSSAGELIRGFGKSGWGAGVKGGEFNVAEGIALDSKGNVYVSDRGNHRIQELTGAGEYIRSLSRPKESEDVNKGPMDVAFDASGNLWATYGLEGKVAEFNPATGAVIREWGTEGTATGQIKGAYRLAVGPEGDIWLSEFPNNRVQVFTPAGEYLYGFGSQGTGAGQFDGARGVAFSGSKVYVVDSGVTVSGGKESVVDSRIEKWTRPTSQSGLTSTEITVDGSKVDSSTGCEAEGCSLTREWTLNAGSYSPGTHTVVAKAKDGAGHTTTKTQTIEIQRDTNGPQLAASGSLVEAPEGWVEQEGYAVSGSAPDPGYGTTQLKLLIDGKEVGTSSQSCPDGGCSLSHTFSVNTATYSGGAHPAELVATDGAGNTARHKWTMNVDPEGHISAGELIDTVEAAEQTASTELLQGEEEGEEPVTLEAHEGALDAVGSSVPTMISENAASGVGMEILEGDAFEESCEVESPETCELTAAESPELVPIEVVPTATSASATEVKPGPEGMTAVSANTSTNADTLVRPIYDGAQTFGIIRNASAPENYSWEVQLEPGASLKLENSKYAEVYYASGHPAFGISAELAHDAIGTTVPTELSVSDSNVLTLTVKHHSASFVYPVVAGAGWQGGFITNTVAAPKDEKELQEEPEEKYWESAALYVTAPEPIPSGEATISTTGGSRKRFVKVICGHTAFYRPDESYSEACGNPFTGEKGFSVPWNAAMRGAFLYKPGNWAEQRNARACDQGGYEVSILFIYQVKEAYECHYGPSTSDGNGGQYVTAGHYLRAQAHWEVGHIARCAYGCNGANPTIWEDKALELHLWPSGNVEFAVP
jgi:hypothetical protein